MFRMSLAYTLLAVAWIADLFLPINKYKKEYIVSLVLSAFSGMLAAYSAFPNISKAYVDGGLGNTAAAIIMASSFFIFVMNVVLSVWKVSYYHVIIIVLLYLAAIASALSIEGPFYYIVACLIQYTLIHVSIILLNVMGTDIPGINDFLDKIQKKEDYLEDSKPLCLEDKIKERGEISDVHTRTKSNTHVINLGHRGIIYPGHIYYCKHMGVDYYIKIVSDKELQILIGMMDQENSLKAFRHGDAQKGEISIISVPSIKQNHENQVVNTNIDYFGRHIVVNFYPVNSDRDICVSLKEITDMDEEVTHIFENVVFKNISYQNK